MYFDECRKTIANTLSAQTAPQTTVEYEAEFELLMQESARLNELMANDRVKIERLKAETKVIRNETWALSVDMTLDRQVQKQRHDREIADLDQANFILRLENHRLRNE